MFLSFPHLVLQGVQRRKRQLGGQQNFPNFFQLSQSNQNIAGPQFPDTQAQIGSGGFSPSGLDLNTLSSTFKNDDFKKEM